MEVPDTIETKPKRSYALAAILRPLVSRPRRGLSIPATVGMMTTPSLSTFQPAAGLTMRLPMQEDTTDGECRGWFQSRDGRGRVFLNVWGEYGDDILHPETGEQGSWSAPGGNFRFLAVSYFDDMSTRTYSRE